MKTILSLYLKGKEEPVFEEVTTMEEFFDILDGNNVVNFTGSKYYEKENDVYTGVMIINETE